MKLPRNVHGTELAKALTVFGYEVTRQQGSPKRVTTQQNGVHPEVIPALKLIKPGTLSSIIKSVAQHHHITTAELIRHLDL